ncbi:MAG: EamA family transporter [Acutalibacteraceae bacterium]
MWLLYAVGSAVFAGAMSVLSKVGIKNSDSDLVTAVRTAVVLVFAWAAVIITGVQSEIPSISPRPFVFLILSGISTGVSWLCYFRALQLGKVNQVAAVDKTSTVLTVILAMLIFHETDSIAAKIAGIILISAGTLLMTGFGGSCGEDKAKNSRWFIYALMSALFAALTSILAKIGVRDVDSNLATAIRTSVVLLLAWIIVFSKGKQRELSKIPRKDMLFIILSGAATGAGWLCYYRALQLGEASAVVPIEKMSILITVAFSCVFLKERLSKKSWAGLAIIVLGTVIMTVF